MGSSPTLVQSPRLSGFPQSGQVASTYGGEYSTPPTHLRYTQQRIDPATLAITSLPSVIKDVGALGDAAYSYQFNWTENDAKLGYDLLVEASFDGGTTYAISTIAEKSMWYASEVIIPKVIPNATVAWNPATQQFDISAIPFQGLVRLYKIEDKDFAAVKQYGYLPRTEDELTGAQSVALSGDTDPMPDPPITAMLDTDVFFVQDATPDYNYEGENNNISGSASDWVGASPTARAGVSRFRITCNDPGPVWVNNLRIMHGGRDILQSLMPSGNLQFGRILRSSIDKATWDPMGHPPTLMFGNDAGLAAMFNGDWVEVDLSVNFARSDLTLEFESADGWAPLSNCTINEYAADGTLVNTINATGLVYTSNVATEVL